MFKKIIKWFFIVLGIVILIPVVYYAKATWSVNQRVGKIYNLDPYPVTIPTDSASYALGEHLVKIKGCTDCHGANISGKIFLDDPKLARISAANLTGGKGGLPNDFTVADWVRAIRHGVNREGKPLMIMPAYEYIFLTERDLGAIIAWCKKQPPVDHELPENQLKPLGTILTDLDKLPLLAAEVIDHSQPLVKHLAVEASVDYGKYLASSCTGCHRTNMKGGKPLAPGFPPVPDVTSTGRIGQWTEDQFFTMLRSGVTPDGKQVDPANMPWTMTQHYTDTELKALFTYLRSI